MQKSNSLTCYTISIYVHKISKLNRSENETHSNNVNIVIEWVAIKPILAVSNIKVNSRIHCFLNNFKMAKYVSNKFNLVCFFLCILISCILFECFFQKKIIAIRIVTTMNTIPQKKVKS